MRKVIKLKDSKVAAKKLIYIVGNSANNKRLATILYDEQKGFCAYTDEFISRTDAFDIDHFNPTLKGHADDNYNNWFVVKHLWNKEKSAKWANFQPILPPTADDLEERIIYIDGDYVVASAEDVDANNLIGLLKLDDPILANNRKKYIKRKRTEMDALQQNPQQFFEQLHESDPCRIFYPRAIREEFDIDVLAFIQ